MLTMCVHVVFRRFSSLPRPSGVNIKMCIHALVSNDFNELKHGKVKKRWSRMSFSADTVVDEEDLQRLAGVKQSQAAASDAQSASSGAGLRSGRRGSNASGGTVTSVRSYGSGRSHVSKRSGRGSVVSHRSGPRRATKPP